jgi:hypothetical protein
MSRLNLSLRPAKVGNQIRNNGEMHGEDSVTAMYIPLKDIMLTKEELNILAGDETFWLRRFNGSPDRLPEPLDVADWDVEETFKHKLEGAHRSVLCTASIIPRSSSALVRSRRFAPCGNQAA